MFLQIGKTIFLQVVHQRLNVRSFYDFYKWCVSELKVFIRKFMFEVEIVQITWAGGEPGHDLGMDSEPVKARLRSQLIERGSLNDKESDSDPKIVSADKFKRFNIWEGVYVGGDE